MKIPNSLLGGKLSNKKKVFVCVFLLLSLYGCSTLEPLPPPENSHFLFITPNDDETFESLARKYLGHSKHAEIIRELNGLERVIADKKVIIPLQNVRPGGLTANGYQIVPVLAYHHFSRSASSRKMIVGKKRFEQQLRYLQDNNFYGITIDQFFDYLDFGQVPEKSIVITIDDGWVSTYTIAYPLLKKYDFPAVLYIPTNHIRERPGQFLSWDQIREMLNDETLDIQPHTKTHRNLTIRQPGESFSSYINAVRRELSEAKHVISNKLGHETTSLSYPYGATDSFVSALVEVEGYTTAFTVQRDGNPFFQNNLNLNRAMIYGGYSDREFIKNIDTFVSLELDNSEPIDESLDLTLLDFQNPQQYEDKQQWRTALIAWKLYRDWLVTKLKEESKHGVTTDSTIRDLINQADLKIITITERNKKNASDYYNSAVATENQHSRMTGLLRTLLYDPTHSRALHHLKTLDRQFHKLEYQVKPNDTLKKIARSVYGKEQKDILIPIFNTQIQSNQDLQSGIILKLPKRPIEKVAIRSPAPNRNVCGQTLDNSGKTRNELSKEHYTTALHQFNNGQTDKAVSSLKVSLCFNPENLEAKEMQELIDALSN